MSFQRPPCRFEAPYDLDFKNRQFYTTAVWSRAREHGRYLSRRDWLRALDTVKAYERFIFWPDGSPCRIYYSHELNPDADNRWMTNFLQADASGKRPRSYVRCPKRLRAIFLYCQIQDWKIHLSQEMSTPGFRSSQFTPLWQWREICQQFPGPPGEDD
jgi:hypothetical protein